MKYSGWNDDLEMSLPRITVYEENTDEPIGNWSGLLDHKGRPLFIEKQRIGFNLTGRKQIGTN